MSFAVNVPDVPGVPSVIRLPGVSDILSLVTSDALSLFAGLANAPWGIYLGFLPIVQADNVVSFEFDQQFQISDYPIEQGQFASYNKVYRPFTTGLRFSRGGNIVQRQEMLDSISAIVGDTNLYNVVTPSATYTNVNLTGYRYQQAAGAGLGLIQVDVMAEQVMETSSLLSALVGLITNALDPSDTSQSNDGTVQTTAASSTQIGALPSIVSGF